MNSERNVPFKNHMISCYCTEDACKGLGRLANMTTIDENVDDFQGPVLARERISRFFNVFEELFWLVLKQKFK